jgi:ubiquinone/menaquinone biosynthesis C-methylase UbiE
MPGTNSVTNPFQNALNVDIQKTSPEIKVICDIQHLPFKHDSFLDSYCFHVLEHIDNPSLGLKELYRVTSNCVEIEVPHKYGNLAKKGEHKCSFNCSWFNRILKNTIFCMKTLWYFPRDLRIHIWIYKKKKVSAKQNLDFEIIDQKVINDEMSIYEIQQ